MYPQFNLQTGRNIMIEKDTKEKKDEIKQESIVTDVQKDYAVSDICAIQEIEIEEVAIDGICGVY
jgi:mycofactocin precursor